MGKSSLLTELTGTNSEAAAYEFTTLTCIPGVIHYNDAKIQLLDLPGIIEGAAEGKGRGRQVGGPLLLWANRVHACLVMLSVRQCSRSAMQLLTDTHPRHDRTLGAHVPRVEGCGLYCACASSTSH